MTTFIYLLNCIITGKPFSTDGSYKCAYKGNKDIVQKVASVGNSYCNTYKRCTVWKTKSFLNMHGYWEVQIW